MSIFQQEPTQETCAVVLALPTKTVDVEGLQAEVPQLLSDCFDHIQNHGMVKGIFRVSGSVRRTKQITSDYSKYQSWLASEDSRPTPHDVATLVKKFTRDYFFAIQRLLKPQAVASLHQAYLSGGVVSDGLQNRSMSFSSALTSVDEEDESDAGEPSHESENDLLASAVARILATKGPLKRNALLFYYLSRLSAISARSEETQMTASNLSITFQPYLLETTNISELKNLQSLVEFLVENYKSVAEKYKAMADSYEYRCSSPDFTGSPAVSPLTECSENEQPLSPKSWKDRRKSWSNALSFLWTTYKQPALDRSPRSPSSEQSDYFCVKKSLSPQLGAYPQDCPEASDAESADFSATDNAPTNMFSESCPTEGESIMSKNAVSGRRSSKRWSFVMRNNSSQSVLSSVFDRSASEPTSPIKPVFRDEDFKKPAQPSKVKRRFSLRLKKK